MEKKERGNIQKNNPRLGYFSCIKQEIEQTKIAKQSHNNKQSLMHAESSGHNNMVYMRLVSIKDCTTMNQAIQCHAKNIKRRYDKQRIRDQKRIISVGKCNRIARGILNRKERQSIAQKQTSGIAHKCFCVIFSFPPHVVAKEYK